MFVRLWHYVALIGFAVALTIASGSASPRQNFFTADQAHAGARTYTTYCASCHGVDLSGPQAPLVGPAFVSLGKDNGMTMGTFFDFIVRDTPANSIASLPHRDYVEIMAYILSKNGYAPGRSPLLFDRAMNERTKIGDAR